MGWVGCRVKPRAYGPRTPKVLSPLLPLWATSVMDKTLSTPIPLCQCPQESQYKTRVSMLDV